MKKFVLLTFAGLLLAFSASADPIFGLWQTVGDDNGNYGQIEVKACEDKICGELVKSFDGSGKQYKSDNLGKLIIWDMKAKKNGKYAGGKIWSPDRDKVYKSKMKLVGNDELKISGCVAILCRDGGTWTRVK